MFIGCALCLITLFLNIFYLPCLDERLLSFWYRYSFDTSETISNRLIILVLISISITALVPYSKILIFPHFLQHNLKNIWTAILFHLIPTDNASWYAEREERHKELVDETAEIGVMFASKAFVQLLANPFVGPLTHKYGHWLYLSLQSILIWLNLPSLTELVTGLFSILGRWHKVK